MKKMLRGMFLVLLCLMMTAPAALAEKNLITTLAIDVNLRDLSHQAINAKVTGYDREEELFAIELGVPEVFDREDVQALKAGDALFTQGSELTVNTLKWANGWSSVIINEGGKQLELVEDADGNYRPMESGQYRWISLLDFYCPAGEGFLLLDHISEETGEMMELPQVKTLEETITGLEEGGLGLHMDDAYVVFDAAGKVGVIHHIPVPLE